MRNRLIALAPSLMLLAICQTCYANPTGNPLMMGAEPVIAFAQYLLLEAGVIFAEAVAYRYAARLDWGQAFTVSAAANVLSAVVGIRAGYEWPGLFATHGSPGPLYMGLAIALTLETPVVLLLGRGLTHPWSPVSTIEPGRAAVRVADRVLAKRLLVTCLIVNLISYPIAEGITAYW